MFICKNCGTLFEKNPNYHGKPKFCSTKCRKEYFRKYLRRKRGSLTHCVVCGGPLPDGRRKFHKYCSEKCAIEGKARYDKSEHRMKMIRDAIKANQKRKRRKFLEKLKSDYFKKEWDFSHEEDLIRIATILDCDGSVGKYIQRDKRKKTNRIVWQIIFNMNHLPTLKFIKKITRCGTIPKPNKYFSSRTKKWKLQYQLEMSYINSLRFALLTHKYLVLKKGLALRIIDDYIEKLKGSYGKKALNFFKNGIWWDGKNFYVDGRKVEIEREWTPSPSKLIAATILDCEGNVAIYKRVPTIQINICEEKYLKKYIKWIADVEVRRVTSPSQLKLEKEKGHKPVYNWSVTHRKALKVALFLREYFLEKRDKIEKVIKWYNA